MDRGGGDGSSSRYSLQPLRFFNEDILFCVDVDLESQVEMKVSGPKGRPITRLDSIKQAILLFVNSKLAINPDHRFAFSVLSQSASWVFVLSSRPFNFSENFDGFDAVCTRYFYFIFYGRGNVWMKFLLGFVSNSAKDQDRWVCGKKKKKPFGIFDGFAPFTHRLMGFIVFV